MMRSIIIILYLVTVTTSCASAKWKVKDVSLQKRVWRFCSEQYDGQKLHEKGFCYISQECNWRNKCRPLPLFCAWNDISCLKKYKVLQKKIR